METSGPLNTMFRPPVFGTFTPESTQPHWNRMDDQPCEDTASFESADDELDCSCRNMSAGFSARNDAVIGCDAVPSVWISDGITAEGSLDSRRMYGLGRSNTPERPERVL